MRKQLAILGLSAGLIGGGAAGFALTGTSGIAGAQEATTTVSADQSATTTDQAPDDSNRPDPSTHLSEALAPLVTDGTITQAQADKVVEALKQAGPPDGGRGHRGGHGPGLDAVATALGTTVDELRTELDSGSTIAEVASSKGVELSKVTDAMLAAEKEHLAADVTSGKITQAQADQHLSGAEERITAMANGQMPKGGPRGGQPPADAPADAPSTTTAG